MERQQLSQIIEKAKDHVDTLNMENRIMAIENDETRQKRDQTSAELARLQMFIDQRNEARDNLREHEKNLSQDLMNELELFNKDGIISNEISIMRHDEARERHNTLMKAVGYVRETRQRDFIVVEPPSTNPISTSSSNNPSPPVSRRFQKSRQVEVKEEEVESPVESQELDDPDQAVERYRDAVAQWREEADRRKDWELPWTEEDTLNALLGKGYLPRD